MITLGIVLPCYNEEEVIFETTKRLTLILNHLINVHKIKSNSKVYFIDDGSQDKTWGIIESLVHENTFITGIKLSRNKGHQNALLAGLLNAEGDALISIDADLQDDVNVIEAMVDKYAKGNIIVYGVRRQRTTDTIFKRWTALLFYKLMLSMGVDIEYNHADYRLMGRQALDSLKEYREVNLFLRGIVPLIGFQSSSVFYDRSERYAGESKYTLSKMLSFAWNGITSFSVVPLRLITTLGFITLSLTILMSLWIIGVKLFSGEAVPGWASTVLPIYFLGGVQIFSIGILGEYLGKIYSETKSRPRYIIEKIVHATNESPELNSVRP